MSANLAVVVTTLQELLDPKKTRAARLKRRRMFGSVRRYVVYIVRSADEILYVGATSYNARDRLRAHIATKTQLGQAILNSQSEDWQIEMVAHPSRKAAFEKEKELQLQFRPKYCGDRFLQKETN